MGMRGTVRCRPTLAYRVHFDRIIFLFLNTPIIHQFSYVGFVLRHKRLCYRGDLETVDL